MRGGGFSCFPCSPLRVPYLWAFIGSSLIFYKLLLLIKKKKRRIELSGTPLKGLVQEAHKKA